MSQVWEYALLPWGAATLSQPAPYIRFVVLWAFAGLVGGRAVDSSPRALLQLPASVVTPIIALLGLSYLNGTQPDPSALAIGVGIGAIAFCLARVVNSRLYQEDEVHAEIAGQQSDDPPKNQSIRPAKWSDIAGYEDVKRELLEALKPLTDAELRERLSSAGIEPTRGVLLYGPPGTGKTLMVRAAASELGIGFVAIAGPEILNKYVGESEAGIRAAFGEAQSCAPAILFFDEIEALVPPRSGESDGMAGVHRTLVATFLGLMDGIKQMGEVVVLAATNAPDQMDSALLRPGRFDRVIYVRAPDPPTRRLILERHLRGKPGANSIEIEALLKPTERFTAADLAGVVRRAYEATQGSPISTEQLLTLIKSTKPSVTLAMLDLYESLSQRFGRSSQAMVQMQATTRPRLAWDDVAGLEEAKEVLRETVILPLQHPDLVTKYGVEPARGVLLYGPPGTGKTFLARVIADQAQSTFLSASGAELTGPEGAESIRRLFARAREVAPAIIFIDEIDAIRGRGSPGGWDTTVQQLLVEMDGVKRAEGIVVLAATNRPQDLDVALLRPGRFDTALLVSLPDEKARRQLFAMYLKNKPGADAVDLGRLVQESENRSPAEIAGAVNAVARQLAMQDATHDPSSADQYVVTTDRLLEQLRLH